MPPPPPLGLTMPPSPLPLLACLSSSLERVQKRDTALLRSNRGKAISLINAALVAHFKETGASLRVLSASPLNDSFFLPRTLVTIVTLILNRSRDVYLSFSLANDKRERERCDLEISTRSLLPSPPRLIIASVTLKARWTRLSV